MLGTAIMFLHLHYYIIIKNPNKRYGSYNQLRTTDLVEFALSVVMALRPRFSHYALHRGSKESALKLVLARCSQGTRGSHCTLDWGRREGAVQLVQPDLGSAGFGGHRGSATAAGVALNSNLSVY